MPELIKDKKKQDLSKAILSLSFLFVIIFGAAIYFLPSYYFIDPIKTFDVSNTLNSVKENKSKLKNFNLEIFNKEKFISLNRDHWHQYNEDELIIGNANPFSRPETDIR